MILGVVSSGLATSGLLHTAGKALTGICVILGVDSLRLTTLGLVHTAERALCDTFVSVPAGQVVGFASAGQSYCLSLSDVVSLAFALALLLAMALALLYSILRLCSLVSGSGSVRTMTQELTIVWVPD